MILVLLGTQNNSFHRLLEEVEKNIENGIIQEDVMAEMIVSQKIIVYNNLVFSERVYVKPRRKKNGTGTCKGGNDGRYPWSAAA